MIQSYNYHTPAEIKYMCICNLSYMESLRASIKDCDSKVNCLKLPCSDAIFRFCLWRAEIR